MITLCGARQNFVTHSDEHVAKRWNESQPPGTDGRSCIAVRCSKTCSWARPKPNSANVCTVIPRARHPWHDQPLTAADRLTEGVGCTRQYRSWLSLSARRQTRPVSCGRQTTPSGRPHTCEHHAGDSAPSLLLPYNYGSKSSLTPS